MSVAEIEALLAFADESLILLDHDGRILYRVGPPEDILGGGDPASKNLLEHVYHADMPAALDAIEQALANPGKSVPFRCRLRFADGQVRPVEAMAVNRFDDPVLDGIVVRARRAG
jgi:PAS domain-containing protein